MHNNPCCNHRCEKLKAFNLDYTNGALTSLIEREIGREDFNGPAQWKTRYVT